MMAGGLAQGGKAKEKLEAARIALISERLGLTPQQAEKFWPVYREFVDKRKTINEQRKAFLDGREISSLSEEEKRELVRKNLEIKQEGLNLEKEYSDRLLNIISSQQIIALRNAEREFNKRVRETIQRRRQQQLQRQRQNDARDRNQDRLRNRREN